VQQTIIDPEGDFGTLAERFGHLVIDAEAHTHPSSVTVLNLEGLDAEAVWRQTAAVLADGYGHAPIDAPWSCGNQSAYHSMINRRSVPPFTAHASISAINQTMKSG
jgi:hypothetical protein